MFKTAFITGVNGQDGSYLAELLLEKGYKVVGTIRRTVCDNENKTKNIKKVIQGCHSDRFILEACDVTDSSSINRIIKEHQPCEIYNLAAQSHVGESFRTPMATMDINIAGTINILESIKLLDKSIKFYQASTSEIFGVNTKCPQSEETAFMPASPYAAAKLCSHHLVRIYRDSYGMFACSGILFNHESPRRGENFVTRKITKAAARIKLGLQDKLHLGNLEASRDWGFAGDYVKAMWLMLQQDEPQDFVISTGKTNTVQEFLDFVFKHAELDPKDHVVIDPRFWRPLEVPRLWGDSSKAKEVLGWEAEVKMEDLALMMYENDYEQQKNSLEYIQKLQQEN